MDAHTLQSQPTAPVRESAPAKERHAMKANLVVHVAGEPEGLVQRCSRCGEVLIDRTGEVVIASTGLAPHWWTGNVFVSPEEQGETDDEATCEPGPARLTDRELRELESFARAAVKGELLLGVEQAKALLLVAVELRRRREAASE
jgi:hypothetical protein